MKSNQNISSWRNIPFKTWKYEKQTEMKHQFLKDYIPTCISILAKYNKRLNYIDGFGGIGAYHNDLDISSGRYVSNNFGSPVFAIESIIKVKRVRPDMTAKVLVLDTDEKQLQNLDSILKCKGIDNQINFALERGNFDTEINKLLDGIKPPQQLAPTIFLIDPFGFSLKMDTIKRIMSIPKSEIIVNFMYNAIQRWTKSKKLEKTFTDLFGSDEWKQYADEATLEKEKALVNLFRKNCKQFTNYVVPFRLKFPLKNRPYYYIFHLTNHLKGVILSKQIFAKHNQGLQEYRGSNYNYSFNDLLDPIERKDDCYMCYLTEQINSGFKCSQCIEEKLEKYKEITYWGFLSKIYDVIPRTESDIKKYLKKLEQEKKLKVIQSTDRKGQRRGGFVEKDILQFVKNT